MGIIQRQGIKSTIINYSAMMIGAFATVFVYPLDLSSKGLIDFIMGLGALLVPYAQVGLFAVYYKYFNLFDNQKESFQKWVFIRLIKQYLIFLLLFLLFNDSIIEILNQIGINKNQNLKLYSYLIPIIVLCLISQGYLVMISVTNQRIVVPDLIRNIIQKTYFPLIVFSRFYFDLSVNTFLILFFLYFAITIPLLFWYVKKNGFLVISFKEKFKIPEKIKNEIKKYNFFSVLNEISAQLTFKLDAIMVATLLSLSQTGIYGIMFYISNILSTATSSVMNISNPIISEKMQENDIDGVESIYKKASTNLLIFGISMFFSIWFLMDDILSLTKYSSQLKVGRYVFLFLAIAKLFDMLTSVNSYILIYSKHYKYNLVFVSILGLGNIYLNMKLIPLYGIEGAAIASLIALVSYNVMKLSFIYFKLKIHPFSNSTFKIIMLGGFSFLVINSIPGEMYLENTFLNLGMKAFVFGIAILVTFLLPIYFMKVSIEVNNLIQNTLKKLKLLK